uniref:Uncharacterized protein n=1 Tax=Lactuca sativa TaxID=4236 RepID=A0A9R1VI45_LACSA|nr:hypothetical protein LSAT_V11C500243000 [Lactuca sativa]
MAESSSVHDTSVRQPLLTIKPQQNLIIDLTPFVYEPYMLYVVECLKYSPLVDAMTKGLSERSAGSDGASKAFMTYVGSRELTPTMLRSIEEADKPAKRDKKPKSQKEGQVAKPSKGQTPKKMKTDKAAPSQPQPKEQKKPARRLILQSLSESDSDYVPPNQKKAQSSDSENESSDEEASGRGEIPPHSPTPKIPVHTLPPSPPPVTIPASILPISQTTTSQPFTSIPIPTPIFTDTTSTTTTKPTFTIPKPPITEHTFTSEPPLTTEAPATSKPLSPTPSTETTPIMGGLGESMLFNETLISSV